MPSPFVQVDFSALMTIRNVVLRMSSELSSATSSIPTPRPKRSRPCSTFIPTIPHKAPRLGRVMRTSSPRSTSECLPSKGITHSMPDVDFSWTSARISSRHGPSVSNSLLSGHNMFESKDTSPTVHERGFFTGLGIVRTIAMFVDSLC